MDDWIPIVSWDEGAGADLSFEPWLSSRGLDRADVDNNLRCDRASE
jgi:hypothetical protein